MEFENVPYAMAKRLANTFYTLEYFSEFKTRRQVSVDQMSGLLEFLQKHPDLAKGLVRGRRGKIHSLDLWNRCARKLNPVKDGTFKDGRGWSKVTYFKFNILCLYIKFYKRLIYIIGCSNLILKCFNIPSKKP